MLELTQLKENLKVPNVQFVVICKVLLNCINIEFF